MKLKLSAPAVTYKIFGVLPAGALFKLHETEKQIKGINPEEAFLIVLSGSDESGNNSILTFNGVLYRIESNAKVVEYAVTSVEKV